MIVVSLVLDALSSQANSSDVPPPIPAPRKVCTTQPYKHTGLIYCQNLMKIFMKNLIICVCDLFKN